MLLISTVSVPALAAWLNFELAMRLSLASLLLSLVAKIAVWTSVTAFLAKRTANRLNTLLVSITHYMCTEC